MDIKVFKRLAIQKIFVVEYDFSQHALQVERPQSKLFPLARQIRVKLTEPDVIQTVKLSENS